MAERKKSIGGYWVLATLLVSPAFLNAQDEPTRRLPVPLEANRVKSEQEVRQRFKVDAAKTSELQLSLAAELLRTARGTNTDASARFALLNLSREISATAGDLIASMEATDQLATDFQVNADDLRASSLRLAIGASKVGLGNRVAISRLGIALIEHYARADQFLKSRELGRLMLQVAKKFRDRDLLASLAKQKLLVDQLEATFQPIASALQILEQNSEDLAANAIVGRHRFFQRNQWAQAIEFLIKSDDEALASVAKREQAKPSELSEQLKIADAWWELAEDYQTEEQKQRAMARAAAWYSIASPGLAGLSKTKAIYRLGKIREANVDAATLSSESPSMVAMSTKGLFDGIEIDTPVAKTPLPAKVDVSLALLNDGIRDARWAANRPISLMPMVEFPRDEIRGNWRRDGHVLTSPAGEHMRVRLPIVAPEEYLLEVNCTPIKGRQLTITLSAPTGERFVVNIDSFKGSRISGISRVNGKIASSNASKYEGQALMDGKPNTVTIAVRRTGIQIATNGRIISRWQGDFSKLGILHRYWDEPTHGAIVLGTQSSLIKFHSAVLTPLSTSRAMLAYPVPKKRARAWYNRGRTEISGPLAKRNKIYLDNVLERSFNVGWGVPGKLGNSGMPSRAPVLFNDTRVEHSITTHPHTNGVGRITYSLNGKYRRFSARIGISGIDSKDPRTIKGSLSFQVFGDGKLLARKDSVRTPRTLVPIASDVSGVKVLTLAVRCANEQYRAYATWVDPLLEK
ncbi:MAG: NPCBM/NEW2 domain-containing protein [Rubripirellula sp.]